MTVQSLGDPENSSGYAMHNTRFGKDFIACNFKRLPKSSV